MKEEEGKRRKPPETFPERLKNLAHGRDEMNLCELPFALLSERNGSRNFLKFEIEDFDREKKQTVSRTLTVKGDPEFGLPTAKDEEIYLGLMKYTSDYNGFADAKVVLQRSALFDLMGWPKSDWAYGRLTLGMQRLVGVRLSYENFWRDNREKQFRDQGAFGILDSYHFRDARQAGGSYQEQMSLFRWSQVLFQSFDCGYLKRIDYGLARELSTTARRLYRYLDKHFHPPHHRTVTIDLARLAYQHIGVSPGIELDKVRKRYLAPAAEELEAAGYLKRLSEDQRFTKVRRGIWSATFVYGGEKPTGITGESKSDRTGKRLQALARRGVSTALAVRLIDSIQDDILVRAVRAMDEQRQRGVSIRCADKWLTKALQDGYQPSPEFTAAKLRPDRQIFRRK
ncbi:MAG: replication initiator protein A [Pirellulaceae bacterium]|nr:replication initiator protein A [Pirellulaceae bacterium]